jgi:DNA helicase-2/ATP-dependent DNA helicase PcrA
MTAVLQRTKADELIDVCLAENRSFQVVAGAGAGKTESLVRTLEAIRDGKGAELRKAGQKVICLTYTKRAVEVIQKRLRWDDLFVVSTLHSFLWGEIARFSKDIRSALREEVIPAHISKAQEDDKGSSKKAVAAREKVGRLQAELESITMVPSFKYADSPYSTYSKGELGHDDIIAVATALVRSREPLRRLVGQKYPYILVDEAQDTHPEIVAALNEICGQAGLPLVGYFGDPMQQIFDKRAGDFGGPAGAMDIAKEENFRCSVKVINLLNAYRKDLKQFPAGRNADVEGSVFVRCITAEKPELPRNRYSPDQSDRAAARLNQALEHWGWADATGVKQLFLVRQMIARRQGFSELHKLFDSDLASQKAKDDFETGEHFLLKPFVVCLYPLVAATRAGNKRKEVDILRQSAPTFDPDGRNSKKSLAEMMALATLLTADLATIWDRGNVGDVLRLAMKAGLFKESERLDRHLARPARSEIFDKEIHGEDRQDWLADAFFGFKLAEIEKYCDFLTENSIYSTQHGVKGEQYEKVMVVIDDIGSAWTQYNFSALLTPKTFGKDAKDTQLKRSRNLGYVCFSRALLDLRIAFFTPDAAKAAEELVEQGLFTKDQIEVV